MDIVLKHILIFFTFLYEKYTHYYNYWIELLNADLIISRATMAFCGVTCQQFTKHCLTVWMLALLIIIHLTASSAIPLPDHCHQIMMDMTTTMTLDLLSRLCHQQTCIVDILDLWLTASEGALTDQHIQNEQYKMCQVQICFSQKQ